MSDAQDEAASPDDVHIVWADPPARRPSTDTSNDAAIAAALAEDAPARAAGAVDDDDPTRDDEALAWALHEAEAQASRTGAAPAQADFARAASGDAGPPPPWRAVLERVAAARVAAAPARAHVPRVSSFFGGDADADHARLTATLAAYGLAEARVVGDGNCQFRALSHQLYGSEAYHPAVRAAVVTQLAARPDLYAGFVLGTTFDAYVAGMARDRTWGDHLTLQAAADALRSRIVVVSTYESPIINVEPTPEFVADAPKGPARTLFVSFWAEVHYNAIIPQLLEGNGSVFGGGAGPRRPTSTPEKIRRWFAANF